MCPVFKVKLGMSAAIVQMASYAEETRVHRGNGSLQWGAVDLFIPEQNLQENVRSTPDCRV